MPKIVDHEAYRLELLDGCFNLFATRGYAALTMRHLAAELGVSTGTLYHYFDSKEELFGKMLNALAGRDVSEAVSLLIKSDTPAGQIERLLSFLEERESYFRNLLFVAIDFHRHGQDTAPTSPVAEIVGSYKQALSEHTMLARTPGLSTLLFSLLTGLVLNRLFDPESVDYQAQAELFARLWAPG